MSNIAETFEYKELESEKNSISKQQDFSKIINALEVRCEVRIGTVSISVEQLKQVSEGQVLELNEKVNEPVSVLLNGKLIAYGELVCCDENFGIKITEVAKEK